MRIRLNPSIGLDSSRFSTRRAPRRDGRSPIAAKNTVVLGQPPFHFAGPQQAAYEWNFSPAAAAAPSSSCGELQNCYCRPSSTRDVWLMGQSWRWTHLKTCCLATLHETEYKVSICRTDGADFLDQSVNLLFVLFFFRLGGINRLAIVCIKRIVFNPIELLASTSFG